ncbi:LysR family transcriptional regulator, partial [Salmonella enterica subsp. enterica serovar Newport]
MYSIESQYKQVHSIRTLTQIHALLAVLEYGGFTEASKRLYMTQSAVSQAISALKEE